MTLRRAAPLVVAAAAMAVIVAALGAQALAQRSEVGIVTNVESTSLTNVTAFTLRIANGGEATFRVGRLENAVEFPPSHLAEHRVTAQPVRVLYRDENGERVAYRIEDAGAAPATAPASSG